MLQSIEQLMPGDKHWHQLCQKLQTSATLTALVLTAWQMGMWFARTTVESQLRERAHAPNEWGHCPVCGLQLQSKGFVSRRMLTLVGYVEWRRRVSRCRKRCRGSQIVPFDRVGV